MVRFINLKNQITGGYLGEDDYTFAFYTTITDEFINIGGSYTFDSIEQLKEYYKNSNKEFQLERLLGLIPSNFFN